MNIQAQICGLIVILLLFLFYKSQKTLRLYRERVFFTVLLCSVATLSTDILSIVGIHYRVVLPEPVVDGMCKAYLLSLLFSGFAALFYVLVGLIPEETRLRRMRITGILLAAETLAIIFSPIDVVEEGRVVYSEGIAVILTYAFTIIYILATFVIAALYLYKVNRRRASAVMLWMGCWTLAAVIQSIRNDLLLVGFAGAIGMTILYVMLESPEANLDKQFNCFNSYAFDVYCRGMAEVGKGFSVLEINVPNKELFEKGTFDPIRAPMRVIGAIRQVEGVLVFKNVEYSLYAVSEDPEKLREAYRRCAEMAKKYGAIGQIEFLMLEKNTEFRNSVELAKLLSFSRALCAENPGELALVSERQIEGYRQEEEVAKEIKDALAEDRVLVYLQPIFSFRSAKFETAEALVRIRGRDGNLVSPGVFIPVAEKRGLIVELGERIFEKVCAFLAENKPEEYGVRYIEVNLSVVQCERLELADQLTATMEKYGISPSQVNFEITETGSVKTKLPLLENMIKLKDSGATFSLDDFGKGESNLIYLIDMPVSILKMDYDLTKSYCQNEKARHVIHSVVSLAHSLGMKVVAEGIETEEELAIFRQADVDYIQGFYFSRPMPMEEFTEFVRRHNMGQTEPETKENLA